MIYDVTDPYVPQWLETLSVTAVDLDVESGLLAVARGGAGTQLFEVTAGASPTLVFTIVAGPQGASHRKVDLDQGRLLILETDLVLFDVSTPSGTVELSRTPPPHYWGYDYEVTQRVLDIALAGDALYYLGEETRREGGGYYGSTTRIRGFVSQVSVAAPDSLVSVATKYFGETAPAQLWCTNGLLFVTTLDIPVSGFGRPTSYLLALDGTTGSLATRAVYAIPALAAGVVRVGDEVYVGTGYHGVWVFSYGSVPPDLVGSTFPVMGGANTKSVFSDVSSSTHRAPLFSQRVRATGILSIFLVPGPQERRRQILPFIMPMALSQPGSDTEIT